MQNPWRFQQRNRARTGSKEDRAYLIRAIRRRVHFCSKGKSRTADRLKCLNRALSRVQNQQRRNQGVNLDQGASAPHEAGTGSLRHPSATPKRHPAAGSAHPALGGSPGPTPGSQLGATNRLEPFRWAITLRESSDHPHGGGPHPGVGAGFARPALATGLPTDGRVWCTYEKVASRGKTKPRALRLLPCDDWAADWKLAEQFCPGDLPPMRSGFCGNDIRQYLQRRTLWNKLRQE